MYINITKTETNIYIYVYTYAYKSATTRQWFGMVCAGKVSIVRHEGVGAPPRAPDW